ncbi:MAG TPA: hypothetical protein VGJ20_45825 [Xanthobacteraceae bacterium]
MKRRSSALAAGWAPAVLAPACARASGADNETDSTAEEASAATTLRRFSVGAAAFGAE